MVPRKKICDEKFPLTPITLPTGNHCYPMLYNFPENSQYVDKATPSRMEGVRK